MTARLLLALKDEMKRRKGKWEAKMPVAECLQFAIPGGESFNVWSCDSKGGDEDVAVALLEDLGRNHDVSMDMAPGTGGQWLAISVKKPNVVQYSHPDFATAAILLWLSPDEQMSDERILELTETK